MPEPRSWSRAGLRSKTSTAHPASRSHRAACRPPSDPPTTTTRGFVSRASATAYLLTIDHIPPGAERGERRDERRQQAAGRTIALLPDRPPLRGALAMSAYPVTGPKVTIRVGSTL